MTLLRLALLWFAIREQQITIDGCDTCLELVRDPEYINRITAARMRHKRELHRLKGMQRELRMANKWRVVT